MYINHFDLKEEPFRITPDPRYLYLGTQHREALAHLLYGIGPGGGFVQLTGEVGTGKTTVCRTLLEQLPDSVDIALILNPALTVVELLATLCEELKIPELAAPALEPPTTIKPLLDRINAYLLEAHARGRRTILIIDEAQNLSTEVLEQVRLLTNLETGQHKLLQIFLIGQPELQQMLAQPNLRQLAQRITARFHLQPLNLAETTAFIQHRLAVAGASRTLFNRAAISSLHRWSGGIPRLLNILCDRSLLGAYSTESRQVDRSLVRRAAVEVLGRTAVHPKQRVWSLLATATSLLIVALVLWLGMGWHKNELSEHLAGFRKPTTEPTLGTAATASTHKMHPQWSKEASVLAADLSPPVLEKTIATTLDFTTAGLENDVFITLAKLWGVHYSATPGSDFCTQIRQLKLRCLRASGTWNNLKRFNLPAILFLENSQGKPYFGILEGLEEEWVRVRLGSTLQTVRRQEVDRFWYGNYLLLWRPPFPQQRLLRKGNRGPAVVWLQQRLELAVGSPVRKNIGNRFGSGLFQKVKAFQKKRRLKEDGVVGDHTWLHLVSLVPESKDPLLTSRPLQLKNQVPES